MKKYLGLASAILTTTALSACIPAAIVGGVEGTRTVVQDRSIGSRVDDNAIAISINSKFLQSDKDLFAGIATDIKEGRVLLTGKVNNPTARVEAEALVWKVEGVREVINEIKVTNQENFGNYISDAWISNQIRSRMLFTDGIKSSNYGVQTVDRVVYLMGIAQNEKESKVAIEIARRTKDVQRVVSHVILKDDPRRGVWAEKRQPETYDNNTGSTNNNNSGDIQKRELPL